MVPPEVFKVLPSGPVRQAIKTGKNDGVFGRTGDVRWLDQAIPLHVHGEPAGALVVLEDAGFISSDAAGLWRQSFWRTLALLTVIVGVTFLMVRWFLMRPVTRLAERLRRLRMGHLDDADGGVNCRRPEPLFPHSPAKSKRSPKACSRRAPPPPPRHGSARLAKIYGQPNGWPFTYAKGWDPVASLSYRIREPYIAHTPEGQGNGLRDCRPSGLVTAIEPMLLACDGVWVSHGSGSEDATVVDEFDRLKVPPQDPRYTLRRVWLTADEEAHYYDGFANEGLWPLCHIAFTRPVFRASDWEAYQLVNRRFADAVLHEMEGAANPIVFAQDYHFALLPRMVKAARPDARVAIFWHIPWPNPEAFGICPWQGELLEGLLGADLIGFHIPLHCNNFLATVDRVLEVAHRSRTHGRRAATGTPPPIRPYPVSVAIDSDSSSGAVPRGSPTRNDAS